MLKYTHSESASPCFSPLERIGYFESFRLPHGGGIQMRMTEAVNGGVFELRAQFQGYDKCALTTVPKTDRAFLEELVGNLIMLIQDYDKATLEETEPEGETES